MKSWLRSPGVQAVLSLILAGYLKLVLATLRWRVEGADIPKAVWAEAGPVIVCFWHSRLALAPGSWPKGTAQEPRILVSLSPDGAFIAGALARLGFPAIRGSSVKAWDRAKPKGATAAFRGGLRWLAGGGGLAITPDGPRGPAEQMAEGAVTLARHSGAKVLLVGMACRPCVRLNSWDRTVLPLPFATAALVWDGPHVVAKAERDTLEATRLKMQSRLSVVTEQAEALVA